MKRWLALCLAATLGCGTLAVLLLLLSTLLFAGGDATGGKALRVAAMVLGTGCGLGLVALVVLLSWASLQSSSTTSSPTCDPTPS